MDYERWETSQDPVAMLRYLFPRTEEPVYRVRPSDRKARLFAVACCRKIWHLLKDKRSQTAVGVAERFADGLTDWKDLRASYDDAMRARLTYVSRLPENLFTEEWTSASIVTTACGPTVRGVIEHLIFDCDMVLNHHNPHRAVSENLFDGWSDLIREVFDNPFDPFGGLLRHPNCVWNIREWYYSWIEREARRIYEEKDFSAMPVLGDALEEAGITDTRVLKHCRKPCQFCKDAAFDVSDGGRSDVEEKIKKFWNSKCTCKGTRLADHFRGCCVIDAILNKD